MKLHHIILIVPETVLDGGQTNILVTANPQPLNFITVKNVIWLNPSEAKDN